MEFWQESWFWFTMMLIVLFAAMAIQSSFKKKFNKYGATPNKTGKSGSQIAMEILRKNGIDYVNVVQGNKALGDNFNPMNKTITLSPEVYGSASIAAEAIAAHEACHAIQWHKSYVGIKIRDFFMPVAKAGSAISGVAMNIGMMMFFFGIFFGIPVNIAMIVFLAGAIGLAGVALFQIVTLPVEFDASSRAKVQLADGYSNNSEEDKEGISKMLNAAAMTYVVAVLQSLVMIMYILAIVLSMSRSN